MARVDDPHHYLDRAFEYYVTGRFAALNNLWVGPNLFHHAVEMLAKFALLRHVSDDRLAQEVDTLKRRYGHRLQKLWRAFKAAVGDQSLDRFDSVIAELDKWEDLRYGGFPTGASITMVFMRHREPYESGSEERTDEYVVVLEDIDQLFAVMVAAGRLNPAFLGVRHQFNAAFREWYAKDNSHLMTGVFRTEPSVED